jgi:DNA-binding NtrC family response regulator
LISQEELNLPANDFKSAVLETSVQIKPSMKSTQLMGLPLIQENTASDGLTLGIAEKMLIEDALLSVGFNVSKAARKLGISRMAMRYRMTKHGFSCSL